MAPHKKISKNSATTKISSRKREIKAYTRKKHIGNLSVLSRRGPVRFENCQKSVLGMLESRRRNSSPDEINLRLRGCRHGTPFRQTTPNERGSDEPEASGNRDIEKMLQEIIELQLTAARLQGRNSLSKIVYKALDYGIQNGIIINGERRGKGRWSKTSSHSTISVTSQHPKDSDSNSAASVSAWGGRSIFRVGEVIGRILKFLKPPIALSVKKSKVSEDACTQCIPSDVSIPQSDVNGYGPNRRQKTEPAQRTYNQVWNSCSEKCSTHVMNSSISSENNSYHNSSCSSTNERPVNVNVNIQADYLRPRALPPINNNPIASKQCFNSKMMENYDLYNYEKCVNITKEEEEV